MTVHAIFMLMQAKVQYWWSYEPAIDASQGDIIQPAPMKNHNDAELQLIEAIVGRTTPFSSV